LNSVNLFCPHSGHSEAFKRTLSRKELKAILLAGYRLIGATPIVNLEDGGRATHDCVFNVLRADGQMLRIYDWKDVKSLAALPPVDRTEGIIDI
jgi:hypothetical protein